MNEIFDHYNKLIDENNDPFRDPPALKAYMDKWDGQAFINEMQLNKTKTVLEIGVGTGRVAGEFAASAGSLQALISPLRRLKEQKRI